MKPPSGPDGAAEGGAPPQAARLIRRIAGLESPLVQVWAWRGSGLNSILRAFCDQAGAAACPLPALPPASTDPVGQGKALESDLRQGRDRGCRWFVALSSPEADLERVARLLEPGERLLFGSPRRAGGLALETAIVPPPELLLRSEEVHGLTEREAGVSLSPEGAERLRLATDGWYRPLREILAASGGAGLAALIGAGPEELARLPGVREFLRREVLAGLHAAERDRLADWAEAEGAEPPDPDEHGLWIEEEGTWRLPRLLAAHLASGRKRPRSSPSAAAPAEAGVVAGLPIGYAVTLFGSPAILQIRQGEERPIECRLRRSFQALAFLATSPELRANRDDLVGALWPNEGERTIERNFHPTLSHLRRSLEGDEIREPAAPIVFRGGVYQLNSALRWTIDTRDFQALAESGRRAVNAGDVEGAARDWKKAWKLYRGPFLQGYFDLWVAERRELLQGQYLELLRDFGDVCIRLDRPEEAMDAYRSALVDDPLQERVQVAVMRLYAAQGRRDLVKRQYDRLCNLLLEDLGVAPLPQTTEDYHRLMG